MSPLIFEKLELLYYRKLKLIDKTPVTFVHVKYSAGEGPGIGR